MSLQNYFKGKRTQLLGTQQPDTKNAEVNNTDNIEIVIECNNNLFENEQEIIKKGAQTLLQNGNVDSIEEGIIVIATIFRGLKYKRTEKDENGNVKIILRDIELEDSMYKKL